VVVFDLNDFMKDPNVHGAHLATFAKYYAGGMISCWAFRLSEGEIATSAENFRKNQDVHGARSVNNGPQQRISKFMDLELSSCGGKSKPVAGFCSFAMGFSNSTNHF
jgi:hypothetical protein